MNVMYPIKRITKSIPVRNDVASDKRLISSGPPAPPTIPEQRMPAKDPWFWVTVFRAREKTMEYIMEMLKPMAGNAHSATLVGPNRAISSKVMESSPEICNRRLLSINLSKNIPKRHQTVIEPQK